MGTTAEKLTYLNTTKQKLKDVINATGGSLTNSSTFRNYANVLNSQIIDAINGEVDLYEEYPKISDEGSNITLTPTIQARLKSTLKGNTEQNGTPTPSVPVNINVVAGEQIVNINNNKYSINLGKNLFDTAEVYLSGNTNQNMTLDLENLKIGTKYKFYANEKVWLTIKTYDSSNTLLRTLGNTNTTKLIEFAPQENEVKFMFTFYVGTGTDISTYDFTNVYIYEYTYELCKIGDYQDRIYKQDDKWYLHKEIGKKYLNELTFYMDASAGTENYRIASNIINDIVKPLNNTTLPNLICSHYAEKTALDTWNNIQGISVSQSKRLYIKDNNFNESTDAQNYTNWINENNVIMYYVLETPTNTEITDTELLEQLEDLYNAKSYNGQTIIIVNNVGDLPAIIEATAVKQII